MSRVGRSNFVVTFSKMWLTFLCHVIYRGTHTFCVSGDSTKSYIVQQSKKVFAERLWLWQGFCNAFIGEQIM